MNRTYLLLGIYIFVLTFLLFAYKVIESRNTIASSTKSVSIDLFTDDELKAQLLSLNGDFQIDFPGKPDYLYEQGSLPGTEGYVHRHIYSFEAAGSGIVYLAIASEYPRSATLPTERERLELELKRVIKAGKNLELEEQQYGSWEGHSILDFVIDGATERYEGRMIAVEDRLFRLLISHPKDSDKKKELAAFIKTFKLAKRTSSASS